MPDRPSLGPRGSRTRTRLLEAAHDAFAERGFVGTRVTDIVALAGTSHGTFYTYFTSKGEAFDEVSDQVASLVRSAAAAAAPASGGEGPRRELTVTLRALLEALAAEQGVLRAWRQASALDSASAHRLERFHEAVAASLAQFLQRDREQGLLAREIDLGLTASAIVQTSEEVVLSRAQPGRTLDRHSIEQVTGMWLRALYGGPEQAGGRDS